MGASLEGVGLVRGWRLALVAGAGVLAAAAGTVLAVALNAATGGMARWFPTMDRYPLWWAAGATVAVAVAGLVVWRVQAWYERRSTELVPAVQRPEPWVVGRPDEVNQVVAALLREGGGTVGITTAVRGAGGFGKTTIAKMVRADPRIVRWFRGRVYWVTVGRDTGRQALPGLVNGLIAQLEPDRAVTFTDARQAAGHLAAVLAKGPRRLLVLDDVWTQEQLAAFPVAGRCARLVTTRIPSLTANNSVPVRVDQMLDAQALAVLGYGLPRLPPAVAAGLLAETGRWPLLLRLVNKILAGQASLQPDIGAVAEDLLGRLCAGGALEVDELTGAAGQQLDVADPDQRAKAVRATIQASTGMLGPAERRRLAELAVFAEDEIIPVPLITVLWQATGGLDPIAARALCARLADLALLTLVPGGDGGAITMHDVIRDFLRDQLGAARLAQLHGILVDTAAKGLPAAAAVAGPGMVAAWWELPEQDRYLWEHLIEHVIAAGRPGQAEQIAGDLRWVGARLQAAGPAGPTAPAADLSLAGTPRAARLQAVLERTAHLLAPTEPAGALIDVLHSRVAGDPDWGPQGTALRHLCPRPRLVNRWPPPDLPDAPLRRVLTGHDTQVTAVAVAPDGSWLATASYDRTARIWDATTGQQRMVLTGHTRWVTAVAVAPDGSWLATASEDGTARIWDATTGHQRTVLTGHSDTVWAVAIAPDGSWLATASDDGTARIWDATTGHQRTVLTGHDDPVVAVAVAPDGSWLATASYDRTARIWDATTGHQRTVLTGHDELLLAVAIAPDGSWLATASEDGTARIWDATTGHQRTVLTGHRGSGAVFAVAIAPDGSWLATSDDGTARIWDATTGHQRTVLTGHRGSGAVFAVAIAPDGWLATGSRDGTVRIWDATTGQQRMVLTGHTSWVTAVAVAPDGSWLATSDGTVRIWDATTGHQRTALTGHTSWVTAVAVAPDGSWLATASEDGTVRIWDATTGQQRTALTGHDDRVTAVAIAPDGSWLATASRDGTVRIWDATTGQQRMVLTGHTSWVTAVAVAPDGSWLATSDGTVRIWDATTGQQRTALTGHDELSLAVAVAPDGRWLATASEDGTVGIWDVATGQAQALMRVENTIAACAWLGTAGLAIAGQAGLYLFDFLTEPASPPPPALLRTWLITQRLLQEDRRHPKCKA